jgi:predicted Zn-dependent protease
MSCGTAARVRGSELAGKIAEARASNLATGTGQRTALPVADAGTGHGLSLPNEGGEAAENIVFKVAGGEAKSVEEMISCTGRGLLVTRLWYIREVDPYEKILTGMTRDGTFLVEDGKVAQGIRNFRFNQSVIQMLNQVLDLGVPVRACGEEAMDMVAPAMRVEGFQFTETTRF